MHYIQGRQREVECEINLVFPVIKIQWHDTKTNQVSRRELNCFFHTRVKTAQLRYLFINYDKHECFSSR